MKYVWSFSLVVLLAGSLASAGVVPIVGSDGTGAFTGSVEYVPVSGTTGSFTVTLKNVAPDPANYLTGFVFNINGNALATLAPNPTANFKDLRTSSHANALDASPYGLFEAGAAVGGMWEGGGKPGDGVAFDKTQTFVFGVAGGAAGSLTTSSFLTENGIHPPGDKDAFFVVRFRGGDVSAKVPMTLVPLPAAAWSGLSTLALLGLGMLRRK